MKHFTDSPMHFFVLASTGLKLGIKPLLVALALLFQLFLSPVVQAAPGDENWSAQFALNGFDSAIWTTAEDSAGNIYVGGPFLTVGGLPVNHIAMWNGNSWSALGSGLNGNVDALVFDSDGDLYVGGDFSDAGGIAAADHIARWDGSNWSALGPGLGDRVKSLAFDSGGTLYVGGEFTQAGGQNGANRIAQWNGSNWSPLGAGLNNNVTALALDGFGGVYAGGTFSNAGGNANADRIAHWNGSNWSPLGSGLGLGVEALVVDSNGMLYAGGFFTNAGGNATADYVAQWNGSSWLSLGAGLNDNVRALALDNSGALYVGGGFTDAGGNTAADHVAKYDNGWSALDLGLNASVQALVIDINGSLHAGGSFTDVAGGQLNAFQFAKWDGNTWNALINTMPTPGLGFNGLSGSAVNAVVSDGVGGWFVAGFFTDAGGNADADNIAHWDGSNWSALDTGLNNTVLSLALDGNGNLYAGGGFSDAGGNANADGIARWDGSSWSALGTGLAGGSAFAIAIDDGGKLYLGGNFSNVGGNPSADKIVLWDGSAWSALGSGLNNTVHALAIGNNGELYVGGLFTDAGGNSGVDGIALWDDDNWFPLGTASVFNVDALAFDSSSDVLYAGGSFSTIGGNVNAAAIAQWNGFSWLSLGSGLGGLTKALALDDNNALYAGGFFYTADGNVTANHIAKFHNGSWSSMGSGMDALVKALAFDEMTGLMVGGEFRSAGAKVSQKIALWRQPIITSPSAGSILDSGSQTFNWTALGADVTEWEFEITDAVTGAQLFIATSLGPNNLGTTATGLPTDGRLIDVTLSYRLQADSNWYSVNESYVAASIASGPTITSPMAGSTFSGSTETFQWTTASGATAYRVWLGSTSGGDEYGRLVSTGNSATSTNLPTDGSTVYATLKWNDGSWNTEPAISYTAYTESIVPNISSPVPGSTLTGSTETFQWTTASGATSYRVWLGSTSGGDEYGRLVSTGNSATSTNLPTDGSTVYATLKWNDGSWNTEPAISYTAYTESIAPNISSPVPGSTLAGSTETFQWTAASGANSYRVWLGSTSGGDEYGRIASNGTSATSSALPTDGSTVYATLKWFDGSWNTEPTVSYTAFSATAAAVITSPVAGSTLSGSTETFQWNTATGATSYRVWLGSTSGGDEYGRLASTGTSATSSALPTDGSTVYATLKWYDGSWNTEPSVSYTAFSTTAAAAITSPVAGSTLSGSTETFQWTAVTGATTYRVWLGSTSGSDEYGRLASTGTSAMTTALPTDGSTVYATLKWYDGSWNTETSISYTASSAASVFTSPAAGSTLSGGSATFQWNAIASATTYRVWLGSTPGGDEYGRSASNSTSVTAGGIPTDGNTVYATLKWFNGSWNTEPSVSYGTGP